MDLEVTIKVKRVRVQSNSACYRLPAYATRGSAGLDLQACLNNPLAVAPGDRALVPTGLAIEMPHGNMVGLVFIRSGLAAKHGLSLANAVGVIDSDYKGEIYIPVINQGDKEYIIHPGERIAQLVFVPVIKAVLQEADELSSTQRGSGGFGSTGTF